MSLAALRTDFDVPPARPLDLGRGTNGVDLIRFGKPVVLGRFGGFFHAGHERARAAVLMLSPFGYEELCVRTTWRIFAERLAGAGLPCLRFDVPGTSDALDPEGTPDGLADWRAAAVEAARHLRHASGCTRLILVGQGLGAALAAEVASEIEGVVASVLMAPVVSGRSYLREMRAWAKVMADGMGIAADEGGCVVAGLALPEARVAAVNAIDLTRLESAPGQSVLLVSRPRTLVPKAFAARLEALGSTVTHLSYEGYDDLVSDPTQATPPDATLHAVVHWAATLAAGLPLEPAVRPTPMASSRGASVLAGDGFEEVPMRFDGGRLFGVLCRPLVPVDAPAVVFVNAGRDYHIGWGRSTVAQARALARAGLTSLRFDMSGVGDSLVDPAAPAEMLYSAEQIADTRAAIDLMDTLGFSRVTLVGRCSGAYASFNAAADDVRVRALVLANISRFVWTPGESVAEAMTFGGRSISDLGATLLWRDGVRRLLRGQLRVRAGLSFVIRKVTTKVGRTLAFLPGGLTVHARVYREVHRRFRVLRDRKVRVTLIYASGDGTRAELQSFMGRAEQRLRGFDVSIIDVPGADHNFTQRSTQDTIIGHLLDALVPGGRA